MKTEQEIKEKIKELQNELKTSNYDFEGKGKLRESINVLLWVLD